MEAEIDKRDARILSISATLEQLTKSQGSSMDNDRLQQREREMENLLHQIRQKDDRISSVSNRLEQVRIRNNCDGGVDDGDPN